MPSLRHNSQHKGIGHTDFYQYNGFVTLVTAQSEGITVVTGYQANVEAWEAWKESLPPDPGPEPEQDS